MLDLGDFVDVLERDLAADLVAGVHGTAQTVLPRFHVGGIEEEVGGGRGAEIEGEGPVGADGDACRNGDTGVDMSSAGVEFLQWAIRCNRLEAKRLKALTLQKSMLLTPLLPRAGPTGGLGDAWPAPTISLTNWSLANTFLAMVMRWG